MNSPDPATPVDKRDPSEIAASNAAAQAFIDRMGRSKALRGEENFGFDSKDSSVGSMINQFYDKESARMPGDIAEQRRQGGLTSKGSLPFMQQVNKGRSRMEDERGRTRTQAFPSYWNMLQTDFKMPYRPPTGEFGTVGAEGPSPFMDFVGGFFA